MGTIPVKAGIQKINHSIGSKALDSVSRHGMVTVLNLQIPEFLVIVSCNLVILLICRVV